MKTVYAKLAESVCRLETKLARGETVTPEDRKRHKALLKKTKRHANRSH